jgi:hypothetical protein
MLCSERQSPGTSGATVLCFNLVFKVSRAPDNSLFLGQVMTIWSLSDFAGLTSKPCPRTQAMSSCSQTPNSVLGLEHLLEPDSIFPGYLVTCTD